MAGRDIPVFYFFSRSYYSKKVWMFLEEKGIEYEKKELDLARFEQYEPGYLAINPRGEVPALKLRDRVILGSADIISFLEETYNQEPYPRLMPDVNTELAEKFTFWCDKLRAIEIEPITYATIITDPYGLGKNCKIPQFLRRRVKVASTKRQEILEEYAEKYPDLRALYTAKLEKTRTIDAVKQDGDRVRQMVEDLQPIFDGLEEIKENHSNTFFATFTVLDIELAILMERLDALGHLQHLQQRCPKLWTYYNQLKLRPSFLKMKATLYQMLIKPMLGDIIKPTIILGLFIIVVTIGLSMYLHVINNAIYTKE